MINTAVNHDYKPFQPTLTDEGLNCFGLALKQAAPCAMLRGTVHSYIQITANQPTPYPIIPDGTQALFISPDGVMIGGAYTVIRAVPILRPGDYFGICFYPGALRFFFALNLADISQQMVDAHYIPCRMVNELSSRLYQTTSFVARVSLCQQWLLRHYQAQPAKQFDQALSLVYRSAGGLRVSQLAAQVGYSSRHLNRLFQSHTGLSSKSFSKIIRLQHACQQLHKAPNNTLNTALTLGFFDQAHLINNYKQHLLSAPSHFTEKFMSDFYNP